MHCTHISYVRFEANENIHHVFSCGVTLEYVLNLKKFYHSNSFPILTFVVCCAVPVDEMLVAINLLTSMQDIIIFSISNLKKPLRYLSKHYQCPILLSGFF